MLDVRVYRAAFVPALIALFVAAFSLADRPAASRSPLAADAFDAATAFGDERPPAAQLAQRAGARRSRPARPGSAGDAALADRVAATLGPQGRAHAPGGVRGHAHAHELRRAPTSRPSSACAPGLSSRRIVVVANRDARGRPGRAELSATATLLELARLFRQRDLRKTLVLVSTSGATIGFPGERAWAREGADGPVDAVLVLGDMAGLDDPQAVGGAVVDRLQRRRRSRCSAPSRPRCAPRSSPTPAARAPRGSGSAAPCR